MDKNIRNRFLLILGIILFCLIGLTWGSGLTSFPHNITELRQNMRNRIRLGLDLRGGTHLILRVNVEDAVNVTTDQTIERLKDQLQRKTIPFSDVQKVDSTHLLVKGVPQEKIPDFDGVVTQLFTDWDAARVTGDPSAHTLALKVSAAEAIRNQAVEQARETITNRIDNFGVIEPEISDYGQGTHELVIELPGVDEQTRVNDIIQSQALLELKLEQGGPYPSREAALAEHGGILPPDSELDPGPAGADGSPTWYLVNRVAAVTGRDLTGASAGLDEEGKPAVHFNLDRDGAARFGEITGSNIGKYLAMVLDHRVVESATIEGKITDSGEIKGSFTPQKTADIALTLRSGALPASITIEQENVVGPSLGADSIRHGVVASIVGLIAIMGFMLVYYKRAGINADVALFLNLIILIAALAYFDAVLTLPGIAGMILTVGMGVDSNVLIFERIREELRMGKAVGGAISGGFQHAFKTIIDTHVTTVVSAAILFTFGTGPIRGFAVTLTIGLVANLFTSVFVSRSIFDWEFTRMEKGAELSI